MPMLQPLVPLPICPHKCEQQKLADLFNRERTGMIVDFQRHYTPPAVGKLLRARPAPPPAPTRPPQERPPAVLDIEMQLRSMENVGLDLAILTCGAGFDIGDRELCRVTNDAMHESLAPFQDRFRTLAHVPVMDGDEGIKELERCVGEYGLQGVVIKSEYRGVALDAPEFNPFWEACQRLKVYVFIHGAMWPDVGPHLEVADLTRSLGREYALSTAVYRLIFGGVLDRFPELKIQVGHLGGHAAVFLSRIEGFAERNKWGTEGDPRHGQRPEKPIRHYLGERIWFDTAGLFGSVDAIKAALLAIPKSQILFGTDCPVEIREDSDLAGFMAAIRLLPEGEAILSGNANQLLQIS
jgi:predicted TIM-barrel fold metal-dependent hydrolase